MSLQSACAQLAGEAIPKPAPAPAVAAEDASHYPPVLPALDPARVGTGVQRTMTLLATSTPTHRNKVHILVYGQSISEQDWWKQVKADLQNRFPDADLDMQNRAIGGFASQLLVKSSEADLYPFYPDLTLLHIYGANNTYEDIVRKLRSTTTSELLIQTDHATLWPDHNAQAHKPLWWDHMMNDIYLPQMAAQYGCGLCDVRGEWVRYLKDNHLEPKQLTIDGTHLNAQGNYLMGNIISHHLVYRPELNSKDWKNTVIDKQLHWENGKARLEFAGNRVDAIAATEGSAKAVDILIDGHKPSAFPDCYYAARPSPGPWSPLFIMRIDHTVPLVLETWTYKVTSVATDGKSWHFDLTGSVTGPDGSGVSTETFTSRSGRVKLESDDYFRGFFKPLPVGFESKWEVLPLFTDHYNAVPADSSVEDQQTTLVQGLPVGKHTIELSSPGGENVPIKTLRIFNPAYTGDNAQR